MWVNNLPKVPTQWNSGTTRESNPGLRVRIPSGLTTRPLSQHTQTYTSKTANHKNYESRYSNTGYSLAAIRLIAVVVSVKRFAIYGCSADRDEHSASRTAAPCAAWQIQMVDVRLTTPTRLGLWHSSWVAQVNLNVWSTPGVHSHFLTAVFNGWNPEMLKCWKQCSEQKT